MELGRTKDNVTVKVTCCIQYMVDPDAVDTFYFKLNDPGKIIESYVDDCIRAHVCVFVCTRVRACAHAHALFDLSRCV